MLIMLKISILLIKVILIHVYDPSALVIFIVTVRTANPKMIKGFAKRKCSLQIKNRSIVGNKVIDWEKATNGFIGESMSLMAIYEIENNLISEVWFIRE